MTPIQTRVAFAEHGENHFCGHRVGAELAGHTGWASLVSLAIPLRPLDAEDAAVLEDLTVCTLAADPRIWPLKVTRLVSSYGGTVAGFCAGHMFLEGAIMGPWPTGLAAGFLRDLARLLGDKVGDDGALRDYVRAELAAGRRLIGFGIPFRSVDERVQALSVCVTRRGRDTRANWSLAMRLDRIMWEEKHVHANHSLAIAAVLLDLGFEPSQVSIVTTAMVDAAFYANAVEEAALCSESLRCLPEDAVGYVGHGPRLSPRASAKRALDSQAPALTEPAFR